MLGNEPEIIINKQPLSRGESMTIRAALQGFACDLEDENMLGDDDHGRVMVGNYKSCIKTIREKIFKSII
jgi:hypothetical protein